MFRGVSSIGAVLLVALFPVVLFAATPDELITKAEKLYEQLEYEEALKLLVEALEHKEADATHQARAYLYMGVCFTALGSNENAVRAFAELIKLRNDFRMPPGVSPSIRANFDQALQSLGIAVSADGSGGPAIVLTPIAPAEVRAGQPIEIQVRIDDPTKSVVTIGARWRRHDGTEFSSTTVPLPSEAGQVAVLIPGTTTGENEGTLLYYLEGLNKDGQPVASAGSEKEPRELKLLEANRFMKPWMWWTVGILASAAVIAGTVAAILATTGDPYYPPGTAGVTVTLR